jgi:Lon protease-like protein
MDNEFLPLFPLELVLLPEEPLPLHIFEDRYKTMIGECLAAKEAGAGQQEFGLVRVKDQALSTAGCTARIVSVTHKYHDGRMDILTVGKRRFEILLTNQERPYLRGAVQYFEDDSPDTPSDSDAEPAIEQFRESLRRLRQSAEMPVHLPRPYRYLSFRMAAALPLDLDFKQHLQLMRSETERLELVRRAMDVFLNQLDQMQQAQKKSGGNGHGR